MPTIKELAAAGAIIALLYGLAFFFLALLPAVLQ